jgi:hypothetical protein
MYTLRLLRIEILHRPVVALPVTVMEVLLSARKVVVVLAVAAVAEVAALFSEEPEVRVAMAVAAALKLDRIVSHTQQQVLMVKQFLDPFLDKSPR